MRITRRQLRNIIAEIAVMPADKTHLTMLGELVPFGCEECIGDIGDRIADAIHSRDQCSVRSADRGHYNGLLNLLRRDKRAAVKELNRQTVEVAIAPLVERIVTEDKSGKGKCPDDGCVQKRSKGWVIISNKTGECWGRSKKKGGECTYYGTRKDAEDALGAYHA